MCGLADIYRGLIETSCFMHPEGGGTSVVTEVGTCVPDYNRHISEDINVGSEIRDFSKQILLG